MTEDEEANNLKKSSRRNREPDIDINLASGEFNKQDSMGDKAPAWDALKASGASNELKSHGPRNVHIPQNA